MNRSLLRKHQDLSASEIEKFLKSEKAGEDLIKQVSHLVRHHEEGGDENQNILCDADCLTYFETQSLKHAENYKEHGKTKEEVIKKFEHIWNRISSKKAKDLARPFYEAAIRKIK
jgi:CRISPR/Cas system-associated protein Cas10 (large subunit of type III CRISPR-Cas system)